MVCRQVLKQHAAVWAAEAEALAGGADSVWQVPWSQLARPGKAAPPDTQIHMFFWKLLALAVYF